MIESLHNLLSHESLKKLRVSYYMRVGIVTLLGLACAVCIGTIVLLPAYFELEGDRATLSDDVAFLDEVQKNNGNHAETLRALRERTEMVETYLSYPLGSQYIDTVFAHAPSGVEIQTFKYDQQGGALVLQGTAETRSDFVMFTEKLESIDTFGNVTFPVSNLAPSVDLMFTITVEVATTTSRS